LEHPRKIQAALTAVDLVLKGAAAHGALLAEEQEARQHVRALFVVQLLPDVLPVPGIVEEVEHEHGLPDPADLRQGLVEAVLAGVRAETVQNEKGRGGAGVHPLRRSAPC